MPLDLLHKCQRLAQKTTKVHMFVALSSFILRGDPNLYAVYMGLCKGGRMIEHKGTRLTHAFILMASSLSASVLPRHVACTHSMSNALPFLMHRLPW